MLSPTYNIKEFINIVRPKGYVRMIRLVQREIYEVENRIIDPKTAITTGSRATNEYLRMLKGFQFFLKIGHKHGLKPAGLSDWEFGIFRPVIEDLVKQGLLKREVMNLFTEIGRRP